MVFKDNDDLNTPDAIFPNNWISFHENKSVVLYPLYAKNRRYERRIDIIDSLRKEHNFSISKILLADTLYCFPPVSIIANDINFRFLVSGQYSSQYYQVKIIELKNCL